MTYILILFTMVFIHIMLDFHQGDTIATMKTKQWWLNHPDYGEKYKYDYIVVLLVHGLSWAFAVSIPLFVYIHINPIGFIFMNTNNLMVVLLWFVIFNGLGHALIDHLKANEKIINLIADQVLHLIQILIVWGIFVYTYVSFNNIKGGIL